MGYFFGSSEKEKKKKKKKKEKAEEVEEEDEFLQNLEGIREAKPKSKNQTAAAADVEKAKGISTSCLNTHCPCATFIVGSGQSGL